VELVEIPFPSAWYSIIKRIYTGKPVGGEKVINVI